MTATGGEGHLAIELGKGERRDDLAIDSIRVGVARGVAIPAVTAK
jgi:hypothetical protein